MIARTSSHRGRILVRFLHRRGEFVLGDGSGDLVLHERRDEGSDQTELFFDPGQLVEHDDEKRSDQEKRNCDCEIHRDTAQAVTVSRGRSIRQSRGV